jgi:hypothetical protein
MLTCHPCAVTELLRVRNCDTVPAVLAIPSVSIEENEVVENHAGLTFFSDPEQPLN